MVTSRFFTNPMVTSRFLLREAFTLKYVASKPQPLTSPLTQVPLPLGGGEGVSDPGVRQPLPGYEWQVFIQFILFYINIHFILN